MMRRALFLALLALALAVSPAWASCEALDSGRRFGDTDCDGVKDAGEEYLDLSGGGGAPPYIYSGGTSGTISNTGIRYFSPNGLGVNSASDTPAQSAVAPHGGMDITRFSCRLNGAPGAAASGDQYLFEIQRSGSTVTDWQCLIFETDEVCTTTSGTDTISSQLLITIKVTPTSNPTSGLTPWCTIEFTTL